MLEAIKLLDRLIIIAKDNETVADLLEQTLNVARIVQPESEDNIVCGPLQHMFNQHQQMLQRITSLENQLQGTNTLDNIFITDSTIACSGDTITIPIVGIDTAASYGYDMNFSSVDFNKNIGTITIDDIALDGYLTKKA